MATAVRERRNQGPKLEHLEVTHNDGCPKERLESFLSERPRSNRYPMGGTVHVTRCLDCGRDAHRDIKAPAAQEDTLE